MPEQLPTPFTAALADLLHAATGPRERITTALIDLQRTVDCAAALITIRHTPTGPDRVLHNYRMHPDHVRHGLTYFIPHSPDFRLVTESPRELFDWTRVPHFRETATAKEFLLNAGYQQGISLLLVADQRPVGTMHLNVRYTPTFTDTELRAIDRCRTSIEHDVAALVRAGSLGLSRRELEVLNLIAWGATNATISDALTISRSTADTHVEHILAKLRVSNRVQAVRAALALGLVDGSIAPSA